MKPPPPPTAPQAATRAGAAKAAREAAEAAALRENLRRRKAQTRAKINAPAAETAPKCR